MGSLMEQNIRTKSKPVIQEISSEYVTHLTRSLRKYWNSNANSLFLLHTETFMFETKR